MKLPRRLTYVPPAVLVFATLFVLATWTGLWMWGAQARGAYAYCASTTTDLRARLSTLEGQAEDAQAFRDYLERWLIISPADEDGP